MEMQAQDGIDYLALAKRLQAMPRYQRKLLRVWVEIMADGSKRNGVGIGLLLVAAVLTISGAYFFNVPPAPFVMILFGGMLMMLVAWLLWKKIL